MSGVEAMLALSQWQQESLDNNLNRNMLMIGSSGMMIENLEAPFRAGMHIFLAKPINLKVLKCILEARKVSEEVSIVITRFENQLLSLGSEIGGATKGCITRRKYFENDRMKPTSLSSAASNEFNSSFKNNSNIDPETSVSSLGLNSLFSLFGSKKAARTYPQNSYV